LARRWGAAARAKKHVPVVLKLGHVRIAVAIVVGVRFDPLTTAYDPKATFGRSTFCIIQGSLFGSVATIALQCSR
jgi:hypothetical protein